MLYRQSSQMNVARQFKQLHLLLWKELIVMWRSKLWTIFEIAIPLLISLPIVVVVVKMSSSTTSQAIFYKPFQVTGDWRDVDRRLPFMKSIYDFCGGKSQRSLALVFPSNVDEIEALWVASEMKSRYSMYNTTLQSRHYNLNVQIFPTKAAMMETLLEDFQQSFGCTNYIAGIVFEEYNRSTSRLSYTLLIRQTEDIQTRWYTGDAIWEPGGAYQVMPDKFPVNKIPNYWSLGFLSLQYAVDSVFLKSVDNQKYDDSKFEFSLVRMPEPAHSENSAAKILPLSALLWQIVALPCIIHTVANVATEKYNGTQGFLQVMGLKSGIFYMTYRIIAYLKITIVVLISALVLLTQLQRVSSSLFIITVLVYCAGAVNFAFLASSIFHKPRTAVEGAAFLWLISIALTQFPAHADLIFMNTLFSLNLNYAFMSALKAVQDHMYREVYLGWFDMFDDAKYMYPFGMAFGMMVFDFFWLYLLSVYSDNVYPCGDSPRKHWLYFLPRSSKRKATFTDVPLANTEDTADEKGGRTGIDVRHLTKLYATQTAVDDLSFCARFGEVTVLLGQNGAGKSATFKMITGLATATSGTIYICGQRLEASSTEQCQREISYCPQHNALFNLLTVREHLELFRRLKGNTNDKCVETMISALLLDNVADMVAEKLSEGMKRKLCVGMSLIGGSRIVLLDEPTVGVDQGSRDVIIKLLKEYSRDKTVLLTTHYMDEAKLLADWIVIVHNGRWFREGTLESLKHDLGLGYVLSIDLKHSPTSDHKPLLNEINELIPAVVQTNTSRQLTVLLPNESKHRFVSLFTFLEENGRKYGINSLGLSLKTLEQVFMRIEEQTETDSSVITEWAKQLASEICDDTSIRTGLPLYIQQLAALLMKRIICYSRQWPRLIFQILLPLILLSVAIYYIRVLPTGGEKERGILLSANRISQSVVPVQAKNCNATCIQNVRHIVENTAGGTCKQVPPLKDMALYLVENPKIPPPVSVAVACSVNSSHTVVTAFFNAKARYGPAIATTLVSNARLGQSPDFIRFSFSPYGNVSNISPVASVNLQMFLIAQFMIVIFAFLSSGFVTYVVDDQTTKFMHQQLLTGLNASTYWGIVILSDALLYAVSCCVFMFVNVSYGEYFMHFKADLMLLWAMYFWQVMPIVYIIAFVSTHAVRAYVFLIIITLIVSICALVVSFLTIILESKYFSYLHAICLLTLPTYGMSYGMIQLSAEEVNQDSAALFSWEKLGEIYIAMAISGFLFWMIMLSLYSKYLAVLLNTLNCALRKAPSMVSVDDDTVKYNDENAQVHMRVLDEEQQYPSNTKIPLKVKKLNKRIGGLHVLRDLTFDVGPRECFGLLGVNGAGKTTTFEVLSGLKVPDSGEAYINGRSVLKKQVIGFCPQLGGLHPDLTVKETLTLLARLRGSMDPAQRVNSFLRVLSLKPKANTYVKHLSGGQRRRLSIAVALITQADFIMLDEPTAGIDPIARRQVRDLLSAVLERGRAILLTSHSMDECEALCTRTGLMCQGSIAADGTPQYLKTKLTDAYSLSISINDESTQAERENLVLAVEKLFPHSMSESTHQTRLLWFIEKLENDRWSELYRKAYQLVANHPCIIDYSLTQTTLDEAFLRLSQYDEGDDCSQRYT